MSTNPRKDSADKGAGSGCMARLVRCSSFIWVGWLTTVALLTAASIMNSVAVTRLRQEVFALRATRTMPQVPQESPRSLSPKSPEPSSNEASQ